MPGREQDGVGSTEPPENSGVGSTEPLESSGVGSTEPPENTERLRLWLERDRRGAGYHLRDAATNEPVSWDDPRIRVVPVAGVSFRPEAVADASFDPGSRLRLVPEPTNEHDPNAVAVWNGERTLQAGYVPREVAAELDGSEQAVSLWRAGEGLRVLIAPRDAWIGRPRR